MIFVVFVVFAGLCAVGQFTHAARYQSRDLGENMKKDFSIMSAFFSACRALRSTALSLFYRQGRHEQRQGPLYLARPPRPSSRLRAPQIFTSSERRVIASAEIFAAALFDSTNSPHAGSGGSGPNGSGGATTPTRNGPTHPYRGSDHSGSSRSLQLPAHHLIIRKDLLDDSNAAKDLTDDVKKRLKILLRPGEPEKRPELTWPKSMKKEPAEVVRVRLVSFIFLCRVLRCLHVLPFGGRRR